MDNIDEIKLNHWALKDEKDDRDYIFEVGLWAGQVMTDEEWQQWYDVEEVLGIKIPTKDQMSSYSCVGQSGSYYDAIQRAIKSGKYNEESAKAFYSQISVGYGQGAYIRDVVKLITTWGALLETSVKSSIAGDFRRA